MRIMSILFILTCAASLSALAQEADGNTATTIRALEHEWVDGQSRNDNRALNLIFDNALVYVEYGQLVTKGDYLARIKQEAPQIAMEAMTVRQFGNTAIVIGAYRERLAKSGQRELKRWRFIDTWVRKNNGWVLVAAAAAPISR
jgi:hypothetical protein